MPSGSTAEDREPEQAGISSLPVALPRAALQRPRHVSRRRLCALLDDPVALTLVIAPAGFGKTELATEWAHATVPRPQWLTGDAHEELVHALVTAMGWYDLHAVSGGAFADEEARADAVARILRQAVTEGRRPTPVVVDNAHCLTARSLELLSRVLAVPGATRLVLLTRRDLPLPTVRLNLLGELVLVRPTDLAFVEDEAQQLVRLHAPQVRRPDVARLMEQTHGWPAALTLAARALDPATSERPERTDYQVLDYLLGESLAGLEAETRDLLVALCHESRITADTATTLSADPDAVERLVDVARDGLLVTWCPAVRDGTDGGVADAEPTWRLHPLLVELLRRDAATTFRDVSRRAHRRGASAERAAGHPEEALRHAVLAGDSTLIAALLQDFGPDLIADGHHDVVTRALHSLSGTATAEAPNLIGVEALARHHDGDIRATFTLLAELEQVLGPRRRTEVDDAERSMLLDLARLRLWRARLGWADLAEAIAGARSVVESAGASGSFATRVCSVLIKLTAAETWSGDLEHARDHASESLAAARALGYDRLTVTALGHVALLDVIEGAMQSAIAHANEALDRARAVGLDDGVDVGRLHLAAAWAHFHELDLCTASAELDTAHRLAGDTPDPLFEMLATILEARLLIRNGRWLDAERQLASAYGGTSHLPSYAMSLVSYTRAHLAVIAGDDERLAHEIELLTDLGHPIEAAVLSSLRTALEGRIEEAGVILDGIGDTPQADLVLRACFGALRLALLLQAGDRRAARTSLHHLLGAVATHRLLLPLTWAAWTGEIFLESLRDEVARPDAHPFAAEALRTMERLELNSSERLYPQLTIYPVVRSAQSAARPNGVDLTPRELEVFEQLALGASYADIARALFVSENTIKTHVAAIYRKLGVDRRSESLRVGRRLGLIGWPQQAGAAAPRDVSARNRGASSTRRVAQ